MKKKKIIILTSSGGAGHISATRALQSYLEADYEIQPVYVLLDIFKSIDPCSVISFGALNGEIIYNYFLRKKWYRMINILYKFGCWYSSLCRNRMIRLAQKYLSAHQPDLMISVTPIVNGVMLEAAKALNIPFMIIPTDLDATSFLKGICTPQYDKFFVMIALNDPLIIKTLESAHIPEAQISVVGFPLRLDFLTHHPILATKTKYGIPAHKPIVLLMMGGQGSQSLIDFAKHIAHIQDNFHVIICMGKDESIKKDLERITFNPGITTTFLGFTHHIAELMAISDFIITKSGSVSFAEGIYMNCPMILDATARPLVWERLNHKLLTTHEWGTCLHRYQDIQKTIKKFLEDKKWHDQVGNNLKEFPKKRPEHEIPALIHKILNN